MLREHPVGQNISPKVANKPSEKKVQIFRYDTKTKQNFFFFQALNFL
jgi:hypothetical protein